MKLLRASSLLVLGLNMVVTSSAVADPPGTEPINDQRPSYPAGPAEVLYDTNGSLVYGHEISSPTDKDYIVIACRNPSTVLRDVQIHYVYPHGDIDMRVWKIRTDSKGLDWLGSSTSTTWWEMVYLYDMKLSTAIVEVYGYDGAQGDYEITYYCRPPS